MKQLDKSSLIDVLQNSELFKNFPDEEKITVPKKYILNNIEPVITYKIIIRNNNDFIETMEILRYWMVTELPFEIYDYISKIKTKLQQMNISFIMKYHFKDFFYKEILLLNKYKSDIIELMKKAAWRGHTNLIKYVHMRYPNEPITRKHMYLSACNDKLDCLKYCHENKIDDFFFKCRKCDKKLYCTSCYGGDSRYTDQAILQSAMHSLEIVKYLMDHGHNINDQNSMAVDVASHYGLKIFKFIVENGGDYTKMNCINAAWEGHLDVLEYLESLGYNKWSNNKSATYFAALAGHVNCIKFLVDRGCPLDSRCLSEAKKHGHTHVTEYLESIL